MKVKLSQVLFLNLCFRIFLLLYILKEDDVRQSKKPKNAKALKHWFDPLSKRVLLVFINGLGADFLNANSTPYIQERLENYGSFGIALTGNLQTNYWGMKTVLSGKTNLNIPYSWIDNSCHHTILDYLGCKCGTGNLPEDLPLKCNESEGNLVRNFHKVIGNKRHKSCLLVVSYDLDPITVDEYSNRLRQIDDDIRFFATLLDSFYGDNKTTYVVTSARGTPVGDNVATDAPVVAWGNSIAHSNDITMLKQNDLAAMLCALLGTSFPPESTGIIPMGLMDLHEFYEFELTLYTIRHYENVLGFVDFSNHVIDSVELEVEQLFNRLDHILSNLKQSKFKQTLVNSMLVLMALSLWGVILTAGSFAGFILFFFNFKHIFFLLVVISSTLIYTPYNWELKISMEFLVFWIIQNGRIVLHEWVDNFRLVSTIVMSVLLGITIIGYMGNQLVLPFIFTPVVLWPVINGSYKRLNPFVVVTRILSGFSLGILPFRRVYSENQELFIITCISCVFAFNFYFLFSIFKREIDIQTKIILTTVCLATVHINLIHRYDNWVRDEFSLFFLAFSLLSAFRTYKTVLERLFKIYLSLFIAVLMLSIKYECVFYFAIVFHIFTWIFIEYHSDSSNELQYHASVFSVEPKKSLKSTRFLDKDIRQVVFYLVYCYVSYFAIGHLPDLHSFDLYVIPTFIYKYPKLMSYFLGGFKFFLPFFITTTSFLSLCNLQEKAADPMITMSIWISDVTGCFFMIFSQFINKMFLTAVFPVKFSHFVIQQCGTICAILSYFIGKHLLFGPETLFLGVFRRNKRQEQIFTS